MCSTCYSLCNFSINQLHHDSQRVEEVALENVMVIVIHAVVSIRVNELGVALIEITNIQYHYHSRSVCDSDAVALDACCAQS